jgi:hypothetical protein
VSSDGRVSASGMASHEASLASVPGRKQSPGSRIRPEEGAGNVIELAPRRRRAKPGGIPDDDRCYVSAAKVADMVDLSESVIRDIADDPSSGLHSYRFGEKSIRFNVGEVWAWAAQQRRNIN